MTAEPTTYILITLIIISLSDGSTLGPAYNEFGYYEHPPTMSRFLCIKIIDSNDKKFGYYEHPSTTSSFLCIYLLVISGTQCNGTYPVQRDA